MELRQSRVSRFGSSLLEIHLMQLFLKCVLFLTGGSFDKLSLFRAQRALKGKQRAFDVR